MRAKTLNPEHIAWCRQHFDQMRDGGIWAVPRNGLVFRRRGDELVLVDRMPHSPEMSCTATELREYQDSQFNETRVHFAAAGIPVRNGPDKSPADRVLVGDTPIDGGHRGLLTKAFMRRNSLA